MTGLQIFAAAHRLKLPLIEEAAANFLDRAPDDKRVRFLKILPGQYLVAARLCDVQRAAANLSLCQLERVGRRNMRAGRTTR